MVDPVLFRLINFLSNYSLAKIKSLLIKYSQFLSLSNKYGLYTPFKLS